ncbi:DUF6094 domain-containing protein [Lysinibacillus xylanilyticus]|uniref:DUF6094 domain-containing protein n=1 Tax=Lysinibacillus xylanilyticus TaxID=582475 RepID=UPI0037F1A3E5
MLDPCCGTGEVLRFLAEQPVTESLNGETSENSSPIIATYGVEIDKGRGATATENLDKVVVAPIESMMISNEQFGLVFLNPPYDYMLKNNSGESERKELVELERALRYLMPGGVLVYIIPHYRYSDPRIARILSTYFNNVMIARFTDENYHEFKQCVFIGYKKRGAYKEFNEDLFFNIFTKLESEDFTHSRVPTLEMIAERAKEEEGRTWKVPAGNTKIKTFSTRLINKSVISAALKESTGLEHFIGQTKPRSLDISGKRPPLPPSSGQIALLLASGGINGLMAAEDPELVHILRGQEVVSNITTEEHTESGTVTKIKTKREVSIKVITPQGIVKKLM